MNYFSCVLLILLNMVLLFKRNSAFQFNFLKLSALAIAIFYTLPSFLITFYGYNNIWFDYEQKILSYQNFLICAFIIVVIITNSLIKPKPLRNLNFQIDNSLVRSYAFSLCGVGMITKLYLLSSGMYNLEDNFNPDNTSRVIQFLRNIDLWGFFILSALVPKWIKHKRKRIYTMFYFMYFLFLVTFSIVQGRRTGALLPFIIFAFSYHQTKGINFKYFFFFSISSIALLFGTTIRRLKEAGISIDFQAFQLGIDAILSRIFNPYVLLNKIIVNGAVNDFHSFKLLFIGFVPSFFFSNKPNLSIGNELGRELGLINNNNLNTGINPGWIGEGYYNHSLLGVILSGFLFGILGLFIAKKIYLLYDSAMIIAFFLIIFIFSGLQMELAASANNFIKGILFLLIPLFGLSKISDSNFKI